MATLDTSEEPLFPDDFELPEDPNDLFDLKKIEEAAASIPDEDFLPATPWDFSDALGLGDDALPARPSGDLLFADADHEEHFVPEVTSEDYDGVERTIYLRVRDCIRKACNVVTLWKDRAKAAEWVFCSTMEDKDGLTFRLSCRALGARHIVLQTRLQYQLYKAGVPYPEPLPLLADGIPETVATEILFHAGEDGLDVARQVWRWPGIRADILRQRVDFLDDDTFHRVLQRLEMSGHLGLKHGFWFLISRNPELLVKEGRRRFVWSKSVIGDY